jgi:very-short-patch-repair endonuclease
VLRLSRGQYALPECPDPWKTAARLGAVVSHESAAQHWGMAVLRRPDHQHVTVPRNRSRVRAAGVSVHWADLSGADVDPLARVTSPLRTVLDCARSLPFGAALAVADSALRDGLVGAVALERAAYRVRGGGAARARRVAQTADPRAESGLESALRAIFIRTRIPGFIPQLLIRDADFTVRVDLADPRRRIIAEADSFEHHGFRAALVRDCERYDELVIRGWRVLRFAWEHVLFRSDWVATVIRVAVAQSSRVPGNMQKLAGGVRRAG